MILFLNLENAIVTGFIENTTIPEKAEFLIGGFIGGFIRWDLFFYQAKSVLTADTTKESA